MFANTALLQGGALQEYRIPMPFTVDEYRVGHDFTVVKSTLAEIDSEGPSGMNCEMMSSERCSDPVLGNGRHTKRRFYFGSRLPAIVQTMLGGNNSLLVEEDAYTFYPYGRKSFFFFFFFFFFFSRFFSVEAVYACPLFGGMLGVSLSWFIIS
jgi:hypothetical protein